MLVSVITINYNSGEQIEATIESVLNQTFEDFEYIVIDGGSSDQSAKIIFEKRKFIDTLISEPDTGIYNAMNKGIDLASGEYCIFMNAGDKFASNDVISNFSKTVDSKISIYNGNTFYIKNKSLIWYRRAHKDISLEHFLISSICHQSTFIKTSLLRKYKYDEKYRMVSDWKFWLQTLCIDKEKYMPINIDVSIFDMSGVTNTQKEKGAQERNSVIKELFNDTFPDEKISEIRKGKKQNSIIDSMCRTFWRMYAKVFKHRALDNL